MSEPVVFDRMRTKIVEINKDDVIETLERLGAKKIQDELILIESYSAQNFQISDAKCSEDALEMELASIIDDLKEMKDPILTLHCSPSKLELVLSSDRTYKVTSFAPSDKQLLLEWLARKSLKHVKHQEMKRTRYSYSHPDVTFFIEEWPSVPPYVEIETTNEQTTLQAAELIGYTKSSLVNLSQEELFKRYSASSIYMSFVDGNIEITHNDLEKLVQAAIENHAPYLTGFEVKLIADHYILAEYSDKKTHGLRKLCWDIQFYKDRLGKPHLSKNSPSIALMDGQREIGPLAAALGTDTVIQKAKDTGVAIVGITGAQRFGVLATWTQKIAEAGLIGVLTTSTEPFTALPDTAIGVIGTNPLSIGVPFRDTPIVYDAAFSKAPVNMMWLYRLLGMELPDETFIDGSGQYTNDPFRSRYVDAFGGHKGSGLAIMLQILSGPLMGIQSHKSFKDPYENAFYFQAIDPSFFQPIKEFEMQVENFVEFAKKAPLREGHGDLYLPGDKSRYNLDKVIKSEKVKVHSGVVSWLKFLGSN